MKRNSDASTAPPPPQTPTPSLATIDKIVAGKNEMKEYSEKAVFSVDALPKKLYFDEVNNFLVKLPFISYTDSKYGCRKLLSQFVLTKQLLLTTRADIVGLLQSTRDQLTELYSRKLTPYTKTKTTENASLWRMRVVLFRKQTKLAKRVQLAKLDLCYKHIEILDKLIKIDEELTKRPRNLAFNHQAIIRLFQIIKSEVLVREAMKLKCIDALMNDVKIEMKFLPRLFSKPEACSTSIFNILQSSVRFRDPLTSFLPETPEAYTFADFMQSLFSPVKYNESQPEPIESLIKTTIEAMRSFAVIKKTEHVQVLTQLSVRYWFERTLIADKEFQKTNPRLIRYITSLKTKTVESMKPPKIFAKAFRDSLKMTIIEFINGNKLLVYASEQLFTCMFQNSPVEIAYETNSIHLRMAGFVSPYIKKDIQNKNTVECVAFLWKLLFICTEIPYPDAVFNFVAKYARTACIPQPLFEKCTLPIRAISQFEDEMKSSKY